MSIYCFGYALSSKLWLRMTGYLNNISSTYVFIPSLVSLTEYEGIKLNNIMWLRMAEEFMSTYSSGIVIWLMSHLLTEHNMLGFL